MMATVVGKSHRTGTSKQGKDYDFTILMVEYELSPNGDNEGKQVDRINVGARMMSYELISVGTTYDFDFDRNGYLLGIEEL